jgi:hypothetical protein
MTILQSAKNHNGFIWSIFRRIFSKKCSGIYSAGSLSVFLLPVFTSLAGITKSSVRIVSRVALRNLKGKHILLKPVDYVVGKKE